MRWLIARIGVATKRLPCQNRWLSGGIVLSITSESKDGYLKTHRSRGLYTAIIGAITGAVSAATASQFSSVLAPLALRLGVAEKAVALTESIKSIAVVFAMLAAPAIIRRCGWRFSFALGALTMLIPQLLMPITGSYALLALLKAIQGFSALLFPLILSLIMEWCSEKNIGLTTALFMGVFYAGGSAGGAVAGAAITRWGWQASFHMLSAAMIVTAVIFMLTVKSDRKPQLREASPRSDRNVYKSVISFKETWLLIIAFLPTIWTIQAIWADVIPFSLNIGYAESNVGGTSSIAATAIVLAAVISGRVSDMSALRVKSPLLGRVAVFSAGMILIITGALIMVFVNFAPPASLVFNSAIFLLSFGAAWGLGSFYCILPELFDGEQTMIANGFIGGIADMAMPLSPAAMAVLGIDLGLWDLAWFSCAVVSLVGLFFAAQFFRRGKNRYSTL